MKKRKIEKNQKKDNSVPGVPCPGCGDFQIKLSLEELLYSKDIKCPLCGMILKINRTECKELLGLVQDLHIATKNVEAMRNQKY